MIQHILEDIKQHWKRAPAQILASPYICKRGCPGLGINSTDVKQSVDLFLIQASWPFHLHAHMPHAPCTVNTRTSFQSPYIWFMKATVWTSHLCFVPAVRLSLWVHRVWRSTVPMESCHSQQGRNLHRPAGPGQRNSVLWVSCTYMSLYNI